jgi:hypothetical protein
VILQTLALRCGHRMDCQEHHCQNVKKNLLHARRMSKKPFAQSSQSSWPSSSPGRDLRILQCRI